jgi:hypothetical protein
VVVPQACLSAQAALPEMSLWVRAAESCSLVLRAASAEPADE